MYYAAYAIVVFAGLAMMVREGLWSNSLTLISTLISGLLAFGLYQPIVVYFDEMTDGRHTYWLDFTVIWALYCVSMVICRSLFGAASKTRMRFKHPIDSIGGPVMGLFAAWVLACFTLSTLHVSPMPKNQFGGKLNHADVSSASMLTSPDAAWLRFMEKMSQPVAFGSAGTERFSAKAFVKIYGDRREKFEKAPKLINPRGA
jgi:hypothetical protein